MSRASSFPRSATAQRHAAAAILLALALVGPALASGTDNEAPTTVSTSVIASMFKNPRTNVTYVTSTPTISWTPATDLPADGSASGVAGYQLEIDDEILPGLVTETSYTPSLTDGAYVVRVRAVDHAGNFAWWSWPLNIVLDTVAPSAEILTPSSPLVYHNGEATDIPADAEAVAIGSFTVRATAADAGSLVERVEVSVNGWTVATCGPVDGPHATCEVVEKGPGTVVSRSVTATAIDRANHTTTLSTSYLWARTGVAERPCAAALPAYCNTVLARASAA